MAVKGPVHCTLFIAHCTLKMKISLQPRIAQPFRSQDYILHEALKNAVEVAIALGQPLLLTRIVLRFFCVCYERRRCGASCLRFLLLLLVSIVVERETEPAEVSEGRD